MARLEEETCLLVEGEILSFDGFEVGRDIGHVAPGCAVKERETVIEELRADKAIGAMFNLAIKIMAIAFMTTIIEPFLNGFAQKVAGTKDAWEQVGIIFQVLLCALILYILVRKISELASGLLNGQPSLGGSSMTSTMRGAVGGSAAVAGNVRGAAALAKAAGHSGAGGLTVGTLAQLGKAAMRSNPAVRGYRAGMRDIQRKNKTETSSKIAQDIQRKVRGDEKPEK